MFKSVEPSDLDDRMSDETKAFVTNFLKTTDPRAILHTDLNLIRQFRVNTVSALNKAIKFDNLDHKEFKIKNTVDNYEIPVTAYIPKGVSPKSPIVVFFHGGGWSFCTRETHHLTVSYLSDASKCIWLSVEYRLAPENKHPIGLNDCLSVVKWAEDNKTSELNAHKDALIGVCGDSAGGNYSATAAHELKSIVKFQILIYPCVDLKRKTASSEEFKRDCFVLIPEVIEFFGKNLVKSDKDCLDPRASPYLYQDFSGLGRCIIIAAELDPLVDQSRLYHAKLIENNINSELHIIKGVHHGYFHSPTIIKTGFEETKQIIVNFLNGLSKN